MMHTSQSCSDVQSENQARQTENEAGAGRGIEAIDLDRLVFDQSNIICDGGSQVEGFGTRQSDYDLYLIYDAEHGLGGDIPETTYDYHMAVGEIDGRTVDIELMSTRYLHELADTFDALDPEAIATIGNVKLERLNTYYRLCIARPLYNAAAFAPLQARFDKARFTTVFTNWFAAHTARTRDAARKQLAAGDHEPAFETYRDCFQFAIDHHLAAHGEAFTSRKYRFSKLARAFGRDSEIFQRAWDLKSLGDRDIAGYADEVERLCDDIGIDVDWVKESKVPTVKVKKSFTPFKIGARHYLVENRTNLLEVPADAVALWSHLDGSSTTEELATGFAEREGIKKQEARARVGRAVEALQKAGVCARSYAPRHS